MVIEINARKLSEYKRSLWEMVFIATTRRGLIKN